MKKYDKILKELNLKNGISSKQKMIIKFWMDEGYNAGLLDAGVLISNRLSKEFDKALNPSSKKEEVKG